MSAPTSLQRTMVRSSEGAPPFHPLSLLWVCALLFFAFLHTLPARQAPSRETDDAWPAGIAATGDSAGQASRTPGALTILSPRMHAALDYVQDRYKVSREALRPVFEAAQRFGKERRVDPLLIVAVIAVESGFNPLARSRMGAHGLMQIIPRYHMEKLPKGHDKSAFFDPVVNVKIGTHILDEYISRRGSVIAGLQYYNGSSSRDDGYASKVLAEKARLELAARRLASS